MAQQKIIRNDHLDGTCPKCAAWEAPITPEELIKSRLSPRIHVGSTEKKRDLHAAYERFEWNEIFICPRCGAHFSVVFSDV